MIKIPMNLSVPTDDDGFITFQCPSCSSRFGLNGEEFKDKDCPHLFCPSCGIEHASGDFLETIDEIKKQIEVATINAFTKELERSFKNNKNISVKAGKPLKVEVENTSTETGELEIADVACCQSIIKVESLVKELGIYCPFCGLSQMNSEIEIKETLRELLDCWSRLKRNCDSNSNENPLKYLNRLIEFIDNSSILSPYLNEKVDKYDYRGKIEQKFSSGHTGTLRKIFDDLTASLNKDQELSFFYQLFKYSLDKNKKPIGGYHNEGYRRLSWTIVALPNANIPRDDVKNFNDIIETHFIKHLRDHLESLMRKEQPNDGRTIHINNYYEQSGDFGIGQMSGGKIQPGAKVAGVINEAEQQNLAEAAAEIQQLLEQLSKENPTETITQKAFVVQEAIKEIESNPTLRERIVSAIKAMGIEAVMQAIDHPLANILREGIEAFKEPQ